MTDYDAEVQRVVTKHRRMRQDLDRCKEELQQLRDEEQKAANSVENVE